MSVSRPVLAAVAAWLAVVAVGSALVWSAISRAGDDEPGPATTVPAATAPASDASPSPSPSPSSPSPSASTGGPDGGSDDAIERRTWQGPGGYVSVECRGPAISLVAAQADAGFVVEADERGPKEVKVVFEGQGEEGRETEVEAECVDGVPAFAVSTENS